MSYIRELAAEEKGKTSACFLCEASKTPDRQRLVLVSDQRGMIVMNKFPYVNGHLLVSPHAHVGTLSDMSVEDRAGLMELTAVCERVLHEAMNPQGMNIGINLGRCAGAGLPGHLHVHVLPRWNGDTNFMSTVGQVRVIPQALEECYDLLMSKL